MIKGSLKRKNMNILKVKKKQVIIEKRKTTIVLLIPALISYELHLLLHKLLIDIISIKVSAKGQIVIPGDIRRKLRIKQGSKQVLRQMGNKLIIIPERDFEAELLSQEKEDEGWQKLASRSLKELWDNTEDEAEWSKYL
jgi:AbrB family looped-hinge helix DNA binding protein